MSTKHSKGMEDSYREENTELIGETEPSSRDELKEIYNVQKQENKRISLWRILLVLAICGTGIVVTVATYKSLVREETSKFEDAVSCLRSSNSLVVGVH